MLLARAATPTALQAGLENAARGWDNEWKIVIKKLYGSLLLVRRVAGSCTSAQLAVIEGAALFAGLECCASGIMSGRCTAALLVMRKWYNCSVAATSFPLQNYYILLQ